MALQVGVVVGENRLVSGQTVVCGLDEAITLYAGSGDNPLRVELIFIQDDESPSSITSNVAGKQHVQVKLTNFDKGLSASTLKPLIIADYKGRKLLLSLASSRIGSNPDRATRMLAYALMLSGAESE